MADYYNNISDSQERCPNCGNIVEEGSVFCAYCGKKIVYPAVMSSQQADMGTYGSSQDPVREYRQVNGGAFDSGYGYQTGTDQTDMRSKYEIAKERVGRAVSHICCIIFMVLLAVMMITKVADLVMTMGTVNRMVSMFDLNGDMKEAMQIISGLVIAMGLFGMIPFVLEVIGTFAAVIGGLTHNIKTTGFTLINAGLILSLVGGIIKSISGLFTVIAFGAAINSEVTRYGGDSIVPYIIAAVLCIVAYLVLMIFFYRGLMRPGTTAGRILTTGTGEIKLSIFAMVILGLNALTKAAGIIGSGVFDLNRLFDELSGILGPMDVQTRIAINMVSGFLRQLAAQQMIRHGVELLVLVFAILSMILLKNNSKPREYESC